MTIQTTIKNITTGAIPFPYLDPTQLNDLLGAAAADRQSDRAGAVDDPAVGAISGSSRCSAASEKLFVPGVAGFNDAVRAQDSYKQAGGFPAFPGMVAELHREPRT